MPHLRSVALKMLAPAKRDKFPFNIPILKTLDALTFDAPITFFVGENGSGKSTLLEGIASAARLPTAGAHENDNDPTLIHARQLGSQLKLTWEKKPRNGFFLRSEDFFGYAKRLNTMRAEMEQELEDVDREFAGRSAHARGLARSAFSRELGALRASYGEGLDAQSHGESFFKLFDARLAPDGLYLLDEPEAPLSPMRQLVFLSMLRMAVGRGSQFIIATHSPILLAYPAATIYRFDGGAIQKTDYADLEHVKVTRAFLANPEAFLKPLFEDADRIE